MTHQKEIANILLIDQGRVSKIINGKEKISWPLAAKLASLFPEKSIEQWKVASAEHFKQVFDNFNQK